MKRLVLFICTILCANVLSAQTRFWIDSLQYEVTSTNPAEVEVYSSNQSIVIADIPATVTYEGTDYSVTAIGGAFFYCAHLTSVNIPNSVTSIGERAFVYCIRLTSVTIPNSVTSIGQIAFYDCRGLTSVTIPNSVTSIGYEAFYNCSSLTSITIPNSVTSIGEGAFADCSSLTSVTIPNSVTSIGRYAFQSCSSLTSVTFEDNSSLDSIGNYVFSYCDSLASVTIPNSVTSIGKGAFKRCSSLTSITIPNSVTTIGEEAFSSCSSLTSVTFGESLAEIGENAFATSSFLQNITCLGTNPPILYNNSFPYPNIATVTVPCGSLEAYSAPTSYWNMLFTDRIEEDCGGETGLEDLNAVEISFFPNPTKSEITFSQAIEKVEVIDLTGKTIFTFSNAKTINIESLQAGVYYLRLTNNDKAIMRKAIKE